MNQTISHVKGVGIILMVIGHAIAFNTGGYKLVYDFIYLFHMPLFFFCSVFFFKDKYAEDIQNGIEFFKKKIKGLWYPYVKCCITIILLHELLIYFHMYHNEPFTHSYKLVDYLYNIYYAILLKYNGDPLLAGFWFIEQLFWCSLIVCGLLWSIRKVKRISFLHEKLLAIVLLLILSIVFNHFQKAVPFIDINQRTMLVGAWFLSGMIYSKSQDNIKLTNFNGAMICCLLLLIAYFGIIQDITQYSNKEYSWLIPIKFSVALLGIYMIFTFTTRKYFIKLSQGWLDYIGNNTMIILALHIPCFKLINLLQCQIYNLPIEKISSFPTIPYHTIFFAILYTIIGIGLPIIVQSGIDKLKHQL